MAELLTGFSYDHEEIADAFDHGFGYGPRGINRVTNEKGDLEAILLFSSEDVRSYDDSIGETIHYWGEQRGESKDHENTSNRGVIEAGNNDVPIHFFHRSEGSAWTYLGEVDLEEYNIRKDQEGNDNYLFTFSTQNSYYKASGWPDHWLTSYKRNAWGLQLGTGIWQDVEEDDVVIIHATNECSDGTRVDGGLIGFGVVGDTFEKDKPWWRTERQDDKNNWPFVISFKASQWLGSTDDISDTPADFSSEWQGEVEALLDESLPLGAVPENTGYHFPAQSGFSSVKYGPEILSVLNSESTTPRQHRLQKPPSIPTMNVSDDLKTSLSPDIIDHLHFPDDQGKQIIEQVEAALQSGKNIIFTGPPGTGKTEIAESVADALTDEDTISDYKLSTATADWSTYDTVGGYMPGKDEDELEFKPGFLLRRLPSGGDANRNEIAVIDEINRADIDKAFGQLFTVLSGQQVSLPQKAGNDKEITVLPASETDSSDLQDHEYVVPQSWRLLATMNTYDKTSLYEMSYAFMRRFAFIRVEAPEISGFTDEAHIDLLEEYTRAWDVDLGSEDLVSIGNVWEATQKEQVGRDIGPAIVKDIAEYVERRDSDEALTEAVKLYIFPQLEGVRQRGDIVNHILDVDGVEERQLKRAANSMLNTSLE